MGNDKVTRRDFIQTTSLAAAGVAAGTMIVGSGIAATTLPEAPENILNYNPKMGYRRLGKTGIVISEVSLGGHFNNPSGQHFWATFAKDELPAEVRENRTEVISACIDNGVNYVDITYGGEALAYGAALKGRRDKMYVAADDGEYCMRLEHRRDAKNQLKSIESCLRRLGTDYLDVWRPQFKHIGGHPDAEMEMCIEVFDKIHAQGKARWLGMSTHDRQWIGKIIEKYPQFSVVYFPYTLKSKAKPADLKSVDAEQLYEPTDQAWWLKDTRQGLFEIAKKHDVGVLTIKPFSAGLIFSTARQDFGKPCKTTPADHELARLTLAYLLSNKDISAVMVGMTLLSEVANNMRVPAERLAMLDDAALRKLDVAAQRMWTNLPPHYQWLKEWECV